MTGLLKLIPSLTPRMGHHLAGLSAIIRTYLVRFRMCDSYNVFIQYISKDRLDN